MKLDTNAIDRLAAEYALGTLKGGARRRFEAMLRQDPELRRAVAAWQDRLHPMALMSAPQEPPASVWEAISKRTTAPAKAAVTARRATHATSSSAGLRFWRLLGLSSTALAAVLAALLIAGGPAGVRPDTFPGAANSVLASHVSVVADDKGKAIMVATLSGDDQVRLRLLEKPVLPAGRTLELWAVPAGGVPRSLGLLENAERQLRLPAGTRPAEAPVLAISIEPEGGSKNPNGPSGPVAYTGKWLPA